RVARQAALAVENALNWQQLEAVGRHLTQERDRLRLLFEVSNTIRASLELGPLVGGIAACLRRLVGHELTALWLPDSDPDLLRAFAVESGHGADRLDDDWVIPVHDSPSGDAFRSGKTVLIRGDAMQRLITRKAQQLVARGARSFCAVPL